MRPMAVASHPALPIGYKTVLPVDGDVVQPVLFESKSKLNEERRTLKMARRKKGQNKPTTKSMMKNMIKSMKTSMKKKKTRK